MDASQETAPGRNESPDPSSHSLNSYDAAEEDWVDEEDDDGMDCEPTTDDSDDIEFFETTEDDDEDGEYQDADDGLSGVEIESPVDDDASRTQEDDAGEETETGSGQARPAASGRAPIQVSTITVSAQILRLLGHPGIQRLVDNHAASGVQAILADDDDAGTFGFGRRRRRQRTAGPKFPKVPSEQGKKLMGSGTFGSNEYYRDLLRKRKPLLATRLMQRELGIDDARLKGTNRLMSQGLIPSSTADTIIHYDSRCYSGQFSDDGNFFFSCAQDFRVRMYDTSNPYKWKYYKTVHHPFGQWTLTDATLSPDNRYLAYSSIRTLVCLAPTDPGESAEPWMLDFASTHEDGNTHRRNSYGQFGIWSIRFSGDGREIVAGTSDHSVYVYDIESRKTILRIPGHTKDVNAVCFGDTSSPHVLYSGSDDTLIKVWDRRSMGDSREAGVFMGHTEGLTYVDSKGDGRYVLSNGKDQTMKLWDLRKMMPTEKASRLDPMNYSSGFDYRFMVFSDEDYQPHPHDCSLVTFRGHRVLKTLIRCHFSPPGSTNSRYVYSGSADGSVYIYNMDATLAGKIDVRQATMYSRPRDPDEWSRPRNQAWETCIRDASWHPNAPVVAATSWNGWGLSTGTCTLHSWNDGAEDDEGEPKMGTRVDQELEHDEDLDDDPRSRISRGAANYRSRLRSQRVPAADDDDENGW
ncbi:MAG: hypothetical protein FRX48_08036 [Lasallia pustulata]|uniref:Uncharacterized protein n=1 Tax=Lasallia pustulata TaxID=136370 RepID=A0A5M8PHN1_9LECA|nr:MAG: hypothetical protein FRX48_08036 [Lasallia pustulata]